MLDFKIHNNTLCVSGLIEYVGKVQYANLSNRGLRVVRRGSRSKKALVAFESIREDVRNAIISDYGDPRLKSGSVSYDFLNKVESDEKAVEFFGEYILENGKHLPSKNVVQYCNEASILNAAIDLELEYLQMHNSGNEYMHVVIRSLDILQQEFPHKLPKSLKRYRLKHNAYKLNGYESLIHQNFCNESSLKVNKDIKRIILSIKSMPQKPYDKTVLGIYNQFINGEFDLYDSLTGELFDRNDFIRDGKIVTFTESTVRRYTGKIDEAPAVDSKLMTFHDFNNNQRPHRHRSNPVYSLSKVSMDDRDLPRLTKSGKRVKAYYVYDVASGCLIGYSFSMYKDSELFENCVLNMLRFVQAHGVGMPGEVEVENHLVKQYFDRLEKMFNFLRVCAPTNSQEKRAEHFNRVKKYGVEKLNHVNIGRFYNKNKANTSNVERVNDENVERTWDAEELIADDIRDIEEYNNQPHPDFPEMSRLEFLKKNANPNLKSFVPHLAALWFGETTGKEHKIYRNQYVKAANSKYMLPDPSVLERLQDAKAHVYWLPEVDGSVKSVYLFDGDQYICKCDEIVEYNESRMERTEADWAAKEVQDKYVSQFDKMVKDKAANLAKIEVLKPVSENKPEEVVEKEEESQEVLASVEDVDAIEQEMLAEFSAEDFARQALENM